LLGNLNFALVPSNNVTRLFVFRTDIQNATTRILARDAAADAERAKRVPNELIVRFKNRTDAERWATLLGAKITGSIPELNAYRLEFTDAEAADRAKEQMANNSEVLGVDYNYYVDPPAPANEMNADANRPLTIKPKPAGESGRVVVGLIDTAVQSMGASLDAFMLKQISVAGEATLDPSMPSHGTSMAETILRSLEAVTKGSSSTVILPVDVYGANANSTTWNVASGIVSAVNNGANVLNLSLGGGSDSTMLRDLIASIAKRGIPIYAAAGNEPVSTPFYPAAYPEVTAVTALAGPVTGGQQARIAPYANYGNFVDIAAPDANVVYYGNKQYFVRGTTAASAYTSGMAAGLFEMSRKNWSDVNAYIRSTFAVPPTTKP
jgi:thermitase